MLTNIGKKIVVSRLIDTGVSMQDASNYANNILINADNFGDYNSMYDFIVANYGKLIIEQELLYYDNKLPEMEAYFFAIN